MRRVQKRAERRTVAIEVRFATTLLDLVATPHAYLLKSIYNLELQIRYFLTNHSLNYTYRTKYVIEFQELAKFHCTTKLLQIATARYVTAYDTIHERHTNLATFTANFQAFNCEALGVALSALAIKCKFFPPAPPDSIPFHNITISVRNTLH
jgi:hypothetical protein